MRFVALTVHLLLAFTHESRADTGSAVYPAGLQPLIAKANVLLSTGQFNDAARAYTEAIEQAPTEYILYYKRATAYSALNRHAPALEDFQKVYSLSGNSFDNALLMSAKIHTKDGHWSEARAVLAKYAKVKGEAAIVDVRQSITEGETAAKQAQQTRNAQLWTACTEHASLALKYASHSIEIRQLRAECALAADDVEGAVGDLTRLSHLTTPTVDSLMRLYRIAYFLLPAPQAGSPNPAMAPLKQCLHRDPDSKPCLTAHRLVKKFEKSFVKLDKHVNAGEWRSVLALLTSKQSGFMVQFETALKENTSAEHLRGTDSSIPLPHAAKTSPRRKLLLSAICKAYTKVGEAKIGEKWCDALLAMHDSAEDADGLTGKGEAAMLKEDWEQAVRFLAQAFDASGRGDGDIQRRLQKARAALKQSTQKDYYKVLNVARNADAKTIKKAYRKAVMTAHPDKGGTEKKMAEVNEAYEVLSKPELRQRFDEGDDPNDPMSGHGGGQHHGGFPGQQHPFAQFFQQGNQGSHSGGFQFHYGN